MGWYDIQDIVESNPIWKPNSSKCSLGRSLIAWTSRIQEPSLQSKKPKSFLVWMKLFSYFCKALVTKSTARSPQRRCPQRPAIMESQRTSFRSELHTWVSGGRYRGVYFRSRKLLSVRISRDPVANGHGVILFCGRRSQPRQQGDYILIHVRYLAARMSQQVHGLQRFWNSCVDGLIILEQWIRDWVVLEPIVGQFLHSLACSTKRFSLAHPLTYSTQKQGQASNGCCPANFAAYHRSLTGVEVPYMVAIFKPSREEEIPFE